MISGEWEVSYRNSGGEMLTDKVGSIKARDGKLSGNDPFGGTYAGTYEFDGRLFSGSIDVTALPEAVHIETFGQAHRLEFIGTHASPDYFTLAGIADGRVPVMLYCSRAGPGTE